MRSLQTIWFIRIIVTVGNVGEQNLRGPSTNIQVRNDVFHDTPKFFIAYNPEETNDRFPKSTFVVEARIQSFSENIFVRNLKLPPWSPYLQSFKRLLTNVPEA